MTVVILNRVIIVLIVWTLVNDVLNSNDNTFFVTYNDVWPEC
jgi:hypothetical protein